MSARRALGSAALLAALLAVAATGCGTAAPPQLHSLQGEPLRAAAPTLAWRLTPVALPAQVDQPQLVLRRADGHYVQLEHQRWQLPLQDLWQDALAERLAARLGPAGQVPAAGRAAWRLTVDVTRFDSTPGRATLVAQWQVTSGGHRGSLVCAFHHQQTVADGVPALVAGHRHNLALLATAVADTLQALDSGRSPPCPG